MFECAIENCLNPILVLFTTLIARIKDLSEKLNQEIEPSPQGCLLSEELFKKLIRTYNIQAKKKSSRKKRKKINDREMQLMCQNEQLFQASNPNFFSQFSDFFLFNRDDPNFYFLRNLNLGDESSSQLGPVD